MTFLQLPKYDVLRLRNYVPLVDILILQCKSSKHSVHTEHW